MNLLRFISLPGLSLQTLAGHSTNAPLSSQVQGQLCIRSSSTRLPNGLPAAPTSCEPPVLAFRARESAAARLLPA